MINIAICEDNKEHQENLTNLLLKLNKKEIRNIETFDSGEELLEAYKGNNNFHILFLDMQLDMQLDTQQDMHLDKLNGMDTARILRRNNKDLIIIITTGVMEYAMEGYSVEALDFILKPVTPERLAEVIKKAFKKIKQIKTYKIEGKSEESLIKVSDIIYFESTGRKVNIYCKGSDHKVPDYTDNKSITEIEKKMLCEGFIRISRFLVLNVAYIKEIRKEEILLKNGILLKYSTGKREEIKDKYFQYVMGEI